MTARLHRWALATSIALFVLAPGSDAAAAPGQVLKDKEAQEHFEQAQGHFQSEDYAAAIPELKAAYGLEPNPMLLYAWGQAERLSGNCSRAIGLYRRFLETEPDAEQRQLAEANLLDCEAEVPGAEPDAEPEPEIEPLGPDEESEGSSATDEPRRWAADPAGGVLLGLGVVGVATGGVLMGVARRRGKQAPNADVEDDYLATRAQAERMNTAGIVILSAGSALVVGAVLRYVVVAKKSRREAPVARLAPLWSPQGVGLQVGFRW